MTTRKNQRLGWRDGRKWLIAFGLLLSLVLTGCSNASPTGQETAETPVDSTPAASATAEATLTPTALPGKVIFVSASLDEASRAGVAAALEPLASQASLTYEERAAFQPGEISADWQVVVLGAYDPALAEALAAHPGVQFIVFSDQELSMSGNLNVIRLRRDQQAFFAGYLSILITPDWRAGGLFAPDESGAVQEQAYVNGGQLYCGICNPYYAPLVRFPITARVAADAGAGVWQTELDAMLGNIVYTVYVSPGSGSPELFDNLGQRGVVLLGAQEPPQTLTSRWAASVLMDLTTPLGELWPAVSSGQGGVMLDAPLKMAFINEEFFSPGRQRLAEEVLADLMGGWIYPLDMPTEE